MNKTAGIYCIRNKVNDKRYIGSSLNIEERFKKHKQRLRNKKHINKHLERAWHKYGENNFEFSILETLIKETEIRELEQLILDTFNCASSDLFYNISDSASGFSSKQGSCYGKIGGQIIKNKVSFGPIIQIDCDTNEIVGLYKRNTDINQFKKFHRTHIRYAIFGKKPRAYGYYWIWAKDNPELFKKAYKQIGWKNHFVRKPRTRTEYIFEVIIDNKKVKFLNAKQLTDYFDLNYNTYGRTIKKEAESGLLFNKYPIQILEK